MVRYISEKAKLLSHSVVLGDCDKIVGRAYLTSKSQAIGEEAGKASIWSCGVIDAYQLIMN
jgi:hypothetical protein